MNSCNVTVITPAFEERLAGLLIMCLVATVFAIGLYWWWDQFTTVGRILLAGGSFGFFLVGLDHYQKQYRFEPSRACLRLLGRWRCYNIDVTSSVRIDRLGRLVVTQNSRRRPLLAVPRGFGVSPQQLQDIVDFYASRVR